MRGFDRGFSSHQHLRHEPLANCRMNGPIRALVSTQSGRAKACARRTCRILREECGAAVGKVSLFDEDPWFQSQISAPNTNADDALVILFVSTTGDGEHTVRPASF